MKTNSIELSYRRSSIEGASPIGLVIALYDTLSGDLRRAANAIRNNDIETRCAQLNHAALVIGQLEDWIDKINGGDLAQNLSRFYAYVRARLFEAGIKQSASLLESQIELIVQVRSAWQERDTHSVQEAAFPTEHIPGQMFATLPPARVTLSQSA